MVGACCHLNVAAVVVGMPLEAIRVFNFSLKLSSLLIISLVLFVFTFLSVA